MEGVGISRPSENPARTKASHPSARHTGMSRPSAGRAARTSKVEVARSLFCTSLTVKLIVAGTDSVFGRLARTPGGRYRNGIDLTIRGDRRSSGALVSVRVNLVRGRLHDPQEADNNKDSDAEGNLRARIAVN